MARKIASLLPSSATVLGAVRFCSILSHAPSLATANSFKELNGRSSLDYFGPRAGAF